MTDLELKAALALEAQYFKDSLFQLGKDIGVRVENPNDIEKTMVKKLDSIR